MKAPYAILLCGLLTPAAMAHPGGPRGALLFQKTDQVLVLGQEGWRKAVQYTPSTRFYKNGQATTADALQPGDALGVRDLVLPDGNFQAQEVVVMAPHPVHGRVLARDSGHLTVDCHHESVVVDLSEQTRYSFGWLPGTPSALYTGMHVVVQGRPTGANHFQADTVNGHLPWRPVAAGLVLSGVVALAVKRRRQTTPVSVEPVPHGTFD